jgi:hypothetical protein
LSTALQIIGCLPLFPHIQSRIWGGVLNKQMD